MNPEILSLSEIENIKRTYQKFFDEKFAELNSQGAAEGRERSAQKYAIGQVAIEHFRYNPESKSHVWAAIYAAHVARKAGILVTPDVVKKVISADQSWKKSSGHAFEEMVKELGNDALNGTGIKIILQRDFISMLSNGKIINETRDIEWLRGQVKESVFDLFLVKDGFVFGCIQSKTSVRDRVTRDREPSMDAMNHFFWSVAFVLDGAFLKLPKFQSMVNGGGSGFHENGWHGLYCFDLPLSALNGRIYLLDGNMSVFRDHAVRAASDWFENRQWFNSNWSLDKNIAISSAPFREVESGGNRAVSK